MRRVLSICLILAVAISLVGVGCGDDDVEKCPGKQVEVVKWKVGAWLSIKLKNHLTYLGEYDPCKGDTADVSCANTLTIDGNVPWRVDTEIKGKVDGKCGNNFLEVNLSQSSGPASDILCTKVKKVCINYKLKNLKCLSPNMKTATVIYTVSKGS